MSAPGDALAACLNQVDRLKPAGRLAAELIECMRQRGYEFASEQRVMPQVQLTPLAPEDEDAPVKDEEPEEEPADGEPGEE